MVGRFKSEFRSLMSAIGNSNEQMFFILFCLYIISNVIFMIGWKAEIFKSVWNVYLLLFSCVMWGSAIYLFTIVSEWRNAWKNTLKLVIIGGLIFVLAAVISKLVTTDSYVFVMGAFFALMAYGKSFKKILKCSLLIEVSTVVLGYVMLRFGIAFDAAKPYREYGGHSLGILYPNNWGFLVFLIMILIWYLYLRNKWIITVIMFWGSAIFMYKYITCLTIAGMSFLFPVAAILVEGMQKRDRQRDTSTKDTQGKKIAKALIQFLSFIFLGLTLLLCWKMDWVHDTFYETRLESMAMRFVEGGYALRLGGVTLFGRPFNQMQEGVINYLEDIDMKIDSAFVTYLIIRGIVAMVITLSWIAYAHRRCLKKRDFRLLTVSIFMLAFSLMERPGLDAWYNFVLLYPLAALTGQENKQSEISEAAL